MAVAFHLLTHRDPLEIERLLRAIWHPDNTYVIHHDQRRPRNEHARLKTVAQTFDNVFIQTPTPVLWARFSLYRAQLEGLRLAVNSGRNWTYWINLSGQCYPLRPPELIQKTLAAQTDTSFVRHFRPLIEGEWANPAGRLTYRIWGIPKLEWWLRLPGLGRRLRWFFGGENFLSRLPLARRALPTTFTWYGRDNWVILSKKTAQYFVESPDSMRITNALRHSALPEEIIFQSVLMNSPLSSENYNTHLRRINWISGAASPGIFTEKDFPDLKSAAENGALFALKFEPIRSATLLDKINRELLAI